jgi:alkanesulfonate monooxygenase SsuD/methylene tetrahydromethanopterin reductase-like flavin-dependent oxidoreductase (luciferase family)
MQLGIAISTSAPIAENLALVQAAEAGGLDLVAVPDHPYVPREDDPLAVISWLLAQTRRIRFFTDVAHLPLRPPAMLAKAAATLDRLGDGRFELGIGAGGPPAPAAAMGGPDHSAAEARAALEEGIALIRTFWSGEPARHRGPFYTLDGIEPGPAPAHPIEIWVGAIKPRMLELTGRFADGWAAPLPRYLTRDRWPDAQGRIDAGASAAGRDPGSVRRIAQLPGAIADRPVGGRPLGYEPEFRGTPAQWIEQLTELRDHEGFDDAIFWPRPATIEQVERFAREVAPALTGGVDDRGRR